MTSSPPKSSGKEVTPEKIAVVIPYYRAENLVVPLISRLRDALSSMGMDWSVVLVDDGSPDDGWKHINAAARSDPRFVGLRLSRNFGQHAAITAGMEHVRADWYVVMDCDLQDRPEDIPRLYEETRSGDVEMIVAERDTSGMGHGRTLVSTLFNSLLRWMSLTDFTNKVGNFRIFSEKVARAYRSYPEQMRFFPALMNEVGFSSKRLLLPRDHRSSGPSSYNLRKLMHLAFDSVVSYTDRPLRYLSAAGALIAALAAVTGLFVLIRAAIYGSEVAGWPSLMLMTAFFGGVQIFAIGVLGLYVGQVFKETKRRPIYIVAYSTTEDE